MQTTTHPPKLRIGTPESLVEVVPYLLGFEPESSLVLVALGVDMQVALAARLDLPPGLPGADLGALREAAAHLARAAVKAGARAAVALVFPSSEQPFAATDWRVAAESIVAGIASAGLRPLDILAATADRWWSLDCADDSCCPIEGSAIPDPATSPVVAAVRAKGLVVRGTRGSLVAVLDAATDEFTGPVASALDQLTAAGEPSAAAGLAAIDAALRGSARLHSAAEMAVIIHAITDIRVRDALVVLAEGLDPALAVALWTQVVQLAPARRCAPAATLLAAMAYQQGDGALAGIALDRAVADDPRYYLAGLLLGALTAGVPPIQMFEGLRACCAEARAAIEAEVDPGRQVADVS